MILQNLKIDHAKPKQIDYISGKKIYPVFKSNKVVLI